MKKHIYKFLDSYVGNEAKSVRNWRRVNQYKIVSSSGVKILEFTILDNDKIIIFRSSELCDIVSGFLDVDVQTAANYIRDWFGETHDLKKVSDIKKFIV